MNFQQNLLFLIVTTCWVKKMEHMEYFLLLEFRDFFYTKISKKILATSGMTPVPSYCLSKIMASPQELIGFWIL